ncbi:hypothetical protein ACETK8_10280 [Brevundimonas staleyi]|uniref:DUF805 domain-containing protein n=1 Tax=Brevundimonas staleyi TaxID=74326 RepID=A0ABW0FQR7_9CAUL
MRDEVIPNRAPDGPLDREALWATWTRLVAEFSFKRLFRHLATSKSGWGLYDVDVVSTLNATPMAAAARPILAGLSTVELAALLAIARINTARNDSLWKMAALFYVSAPVTTVLAAFQIAPTFTKKVLETGGIGFVLIFLSLTISLIFYYSINWRAGQVAVLIELELIERGHQTVAPSVSAGEQ